MADQNTMTPEDAQQRWCPFVRAGDAKDVGATNRPLQYAGKTRNDVRCIAALCMAWQWDSGSDGQGFCGLARQ